MKLEEIEQNKRIPLKIKMLIDYFYIIMSKIAFIYC